LELVATKGKEIHSIVTDSRYIGRFLDIAIEERDRVCRHFGCNVSYPLERDHIIEIRDGGLTKYLNLARVCPIHHDLKTFKNWHWEDVFGANMRLVPPEPPPDPTGPPNDEPCQGELLNDDP
jgi:hypothetical protein